MSSINKGKEPAVIEQQLEEEEEEEEEKVVSTQQLEGMVVLLCNDGEPFLLEVSLVKNFLTLGPIEGLESKTVTLPQVTSPVMANIVEYLKREAKAAAAAREGDNEANKKMKEFERECVKMERDEMFDMLNALNYLNCQRMQDLLCKAVADLVKNMSVEEMRDYFKIENDYTPEEEEEVRRENDWAFD